jgi:thioredoxin-related protein
MNMERSKIKQYLEVSTNIAVLILVLVVLTVLARGYFVNKQRPGIKNGLQKGQYLTQLSNYTYSSSPKTLLIVMNTGCSFCAESMPFYKQLVKALKENGSMTHVVAVFPNTEMETQGYLKENKLQIDAVPNIDFNSLNVSGTPTIILTDDTGKILDFWIGKLSEEAGTEVIKEIATPKT